jgi:hypothetical protein
MQKIPVTNKDAGKKLQARKAKEREGRKGLLHG